MLHWCRISTITLRYLEILNGVSDFALLHYSDDIVSAMASQITGVSIVYSTVCSGADQRKHQTSASLTFVGGGGGGIHRWPVNSPHQEPVTRKMFPFDDVIMKGCDYPCFPAFLIPTIATFWCISKYGRNFTCNCDWLLSCERFVKQ